MPRFGFAIDNRACIGCHACTVACKSEHSVPLGVNRTWVKYIEKGAFPHTRRHFSVQRCNHCDDAPCVEICPVTALFRRPDGIVDFDSERCIGCKACMQACPYDALYLDPQTQTAAKCNYCTHRVDSGYEPACVVVCPVDAIVSGDLDDPDSRIAQLDRLEKVQYPKLEKNTRPKLFYVGGEAAALDPTVAPPRDDYLWSGNDGRLTRASLERAGDEALAESRARRVYDARSKPPPWGWMVSAYITTKAIAAGVLLAAFVLYLAGVGAGGDAALSLPLPVALISLAFLLATGALLVGDLKRPERFLYVLLRPQWRSWLVRGGYLIAALGLYVPLWWLLSALQSPRGVQVVGGAVGAVLATCVAAYTALLLAQAKGRDYWQNPLLVVTMAVDALAAGIAVLVLFDLEPARGAPAGSKAAWLAIAAAGLGALLVAEFLPKHSTRGAELAARIILRGPFALLFWGGVVTGGILAPLMLSATAPKLAALLLLGGIAAKNHVLVQAPQRVPLS
jgi:Fe-S-cluster-containing dehydrogenase component/formate-dependent nitrite reductase membrane component NrfD